MLPIDSMHGETVCPKWATLTWLAVHWNSVLLTNDKTGKGKTPVAAPSPPRLGPTAGLYDWTSVQFLLFKTQLLCSYWKLDFKIQQISNRSLVRWFLVDLWLMVTVRLTARINHLWLPGWKLVVVDVGFGFISLTLFFNGMCAVWDVLSWILQTDLHFFTKCIFVPFPPPGITSTIIFTAATASVSCFCPVLSPGILFTRLPHVQLIALSLSGQVFMLHCFWLV